RAVIQNARAIPISNDREILHVIAQGFSLDRQRGVPDPVGMEGSLLEVEVHIVTAATSHLNNLSKAVTEAGFEVLAPVYTLKALGELVVTPEERDLGCLLVDSAGNEHRAELNVEKLWNPFITAHGTRHGKMGLVELRAVRMPER
ncbi:MAG: transglutaminase family protein, partial [Elusimicrobiota bacterium]